MNDAFPVSSSKDSPLEACILSSRESEVLRHIAWGYTNKEIAARLEVSAKTVETYKTRGLEKLQLKSRRALVEHAVKSGWFAEPPGTVADILPMPSTNGDGYAAEL